eukprot:2636981-Rhodomonas_salina.1
MLDNDVLEHVECDAVHEGKSVVVEVSVMLCLGEDRCEVYSRYGVVHQGTRRSVFMEVGVVLCMRVGVCDDDDDVDGAAQC